MDFEGVKTWLGGQARKRAEVCGLKAATGFVLAPVAVWFAAMCVYWVVKCLLSRRGPPQPGDTAICFWFSAAAVPLMFIGNRLTPRRNLMEERMESDATDLAMARYGVGRSQVLFALVLWIMFTGPRLVDWGLASARERRQWRAYDAHSCGAVLWLLASRLKKVPYDEIQREIPWLNLDETGPELLKIPGVLKLKTPPPGLGLTDDLRQVIATRGNLEF
jgi:hypothetical protein